MKRLGAEFKYSIVSEGTMIAKDIFYAVRHLLPEDMLSKYEQIFEFSNDIAEQQYILNEIIWEYLNSIAPKNCYFGSSQGDGACFGFWEVEEE